MEFKYPPSAHIATEMAVPVVTNYSSTPILTIILQVLRDQEKPKEEKEETEEDKKESIKDEMTSAWRVISFFFVVFVLPTILISVPLYARYHIYHAKSHILTDGDMQSYHNDVSSFWCQGQRLIGNGSFEAYLTKETKRAKTKRISHLSSNLLLMNDEIEEWGVHLIKGSHFKFSACSRWPGGTLLVVQGEENMRRCFYKEERIHNELNGEETKKNNKKTVPNIKEIPNYEEILMGEGELLDNYDELSQHDIVRKLYSSSRTEDGKSSSTTEKYSTTMSSVSAISTTSASNSTEETIEKKDFIKVTKKVKNGKEKKKKRRKVKHLNKQSVNGTTNITNDKVTTDAHKIVKRALNTSRMESLLVDKGSIFYNINDTLDVTTGNSSFSSSEEFLRQCSTTIVSIDLTPYPDCTQRTTPLNDTSMTWRFRVNETDYYYFIFTSDNSIEANVLGFSVLLERRLYNVSENLGKCSNQSECVFPFSFMRSEGVIVDFSEHYENISTLDQLHNYEITAICQPRTVVYTVFILCVPFIIILFAFR